jgi:hypothetical protein
LAGGAFWAAWLVARVDCSVLYVAFGNVAPGESAGVRMPLD